MVCVNINRVFNLVKPHILSYNNQIKQSVTSLNNSIKTDITTVCDPSVGTILILEEESILLPYDTSATYVKVISNAKWEVTE